MKQWKFGVIVFSAGLCLLLAGCSTPATPPFVSPLAPPAWIIGEWQNNDGTKSWTFSADNAVLTSNGNPTDFKELSKEDDIEILEDINSTDTYQITVADGVGLETYHYFSKQSETTLTYFVSDNGGGFFPPPQDYTKQ